MTILSHPDFARVRLKIGKTLPCTQVNNPSKLTAVQIDTPTFRPVPGKERRKT